MNQGRKSRRTGRPTGRSKAAGRASDRPTRSPGARKPRKGRSGPRIAPASLTAFVRAGGAVSLREWLRLDPSIQAALERAGTEVRAEFALAVATALSGEAGAMAVAGQADPRATDDVAMERALDVSMRLLRGAGGAR